MVYNNKSYTSSRYFFYFKIFSIIDYISMFDYIVTYSLNSLLSYYLKFVSIIFSYLFSFLLLF